MANLLIVIDAQEDFIRGSLGTPEAQKIIPRLQAIVKEYMINGDTVIYTLDTHTRKDATSALSRYFIWSWTIA